MGLLQTVRDGIDTAFDSAGDLVTAAVLHVKSRNDYDTNVLRPVITYTDTSIEKVLVTSFTAKELENRGILPSDQKVLIKGIDAPARPIPEDDRITISGKIWQIKGVSAAPLNVLYILQVRAIE